MHSIATGRHKPKRARQTGNDKKQKQKQERTKKPKTHFKLYFQLAFLFTTFIFICLNSFNFHVIWIILSRSRFLLGWACALVWRAGWVCARARKDVIIVFTLSEQPKPKREEIATMYCNGKWQRNFMWCAPHLPENRGVGGGGGGDDTHKKRS